jgi:hypothetical protein
MNFSLASCALATESKRQMQGGSHQLRVELLEGSFGGHEQGTLVQMLSSLHALTVDGKVGEDGTRMTSGTIQSTEC